MLYMVTFTINIPPMLAHIPYMDPMGIYIYTDRCIVSFMVPTPFKTTTQARIIIPNRNGTT